MAASARDAVDGAGGDPPELAGGPPIAHLIDRRGRCRLVYEPIADLARGTICGYEAVERFPEAPAPEVWRTEALRRGLEPDFDAYVVSSVLHARESLPEGCFLAFNIRPATLLREPVRRVLSRAGDLHGLVIELVPRVLRRDEGRLLTCLAELREAGARFALEVGGEDAVLRFVGLVRPAFAKLNALLVADLDRVPAKRALLYEIERIATRFGATVVAQGVSRVEELDALLRLRVPLAQGPLIGVHGKTLTPVAFPLSRYVRERGAAMLEPGSLASLVERVPALSADEHAGAAAAFAADAGLEWVVLVDARGRPVGLHSREGCGRGEAPVGQALVVGATNGIAEVAQRAMLRAPAQRFDPLVCCDANGGYAGIVVLDRLVEALTRAADRGVGGTGSPVDTTATPGF